MKSVIKVACVFLATAAVSVYLGLYNEINGTFALKEVPSFSQVSNLTISSVSRDVNLEVIESRKTRLKQACKELSYQNLVNLSRVRAYMNPNRTVLYCRINKCASTFMLRILTNIFKCDTDCLLRNGQYIAKSANAYRIMTDVFSFTFVRDPYRRLFSTYGNIFYMPKEDWLTRGRTLIKKVRSGSSATTSNFGHNLTFFEMIKYIVTSYEQGKPIDEHLRPMSHVSCDPCLFDFDFIGKVETVDSDWTYMLEAWRKRNIIAGNLPTVVTETKRQIRESYGPVKHTFNLKKKIRKENLLISSHSILTRLWAFYQMTGVISKEIPMPFTSTQSESVKQDEFTQKVKEAVKWSKLMGKEVEGQRDEAMIQAYRTVPELYMEKLRKYLQKDCFLFGYDDRPALLFKRDIKLQSEFDYFKGL